jgi:hypothetical protein
VPSRGASMKEASHGETGSRVDTTRHRLALQIKRWPAWMLHSSCRRLAPL